VQQAGGWLFDQVMAGWDVTVITVDRGDSRPLDILGVRPCVLDTALVVPVFGACLQALALRSDLYHADARVRRLVLNAAEAGGTEIRLWGDLWPADFADEAGQVSHRLSLAARAFKAEALAAAAVTAEPPMDTEVFRRGEIRRSASSRTITARSRLLSKLIDPNHARHMTFLIPFLPERLMSCEQTISSRSRFSRR
jgi:hypothetical protein